MLGAICPSPCGIGLNAFMADFSQSSTFLSAFPTIPNYAIPENQDGKSKEIANGPYKPNAYLLISLFHLPLPSPTGSKTLKKPAYLWKHKENCDTMFIL